MHREIVRKRSLARHGGRHEPEPQALGNVPVFAVFTPNVSQRRVEEAIMKQVDAARTQGITEYEMEKVKNSVLTNRVYELYSSDHICQKLAYSEAIEGDYRLWVERLSALETMSVETLMQAAQRYWVEARPPYVVPQTEKVNPLLFAAGMFRKLVPQ